MKLSFDRWLSIGYVLLFAMLPFSRSGRVGAHAIELPSEPLLIMMALGVGWYFPWKQWRQFLRHPITIFSILHLSTMVLSVAWSVTPITSIKYTIIEGLHWWVFYLGLLQFNYDQPTHLSKQFRWSLSAYLFSFSAIMFYAWYQHSQYDFSMATSVTVARPFYYDHALYGSCAALLLGPVLYWASAKKQNFQRQIGYWLAAFVLVVSLYFSFSRAVWLSLVVAGGLVALLYFLRPQFWSFVTALGGLFICLALTATLWLPLLHNNQAESKTGTLSEQLSSIGNVTTDVSNLERINRYSCAWRMFLDRPLTGFGVGTYETAYLPYQLPEQMTRISVTHAGPHPPGRGGGAHSEFLQALSERGILGGLSWFGLLFTSFFAVLFARAGSVGFRYLILFSLTTFYVHAVFNNFLHHGKFAGVFWLLLAFLASSSRDKRA